MCFIRKHDRSFLLLPARKGYPAPPPTLHVLMGYWSQLTEAMIAQGLNYVLNIIRKSCLMKSISINCGLADKSRHSTGHPGNQCNFKNWQGLGARQALMRRPAPEQDGVCLENRWRWPGHHHSKNPLHGPLLGAMGCRSFHHPSKYSPEFCGSSTSSLLPPWPQQRPNWIEFRQVTWQHPWLLQQAKSQKSQCLFASTLEYQL